MDEFTKTKVGFTVALLAALFAVKPIIDNYGALGFFFFNTKLSLNHAFYITTGLLTLAVYCISLQFISTKQISILSKISNFSYALSISTPIIYLTLWASVILANWISDLSAIIPTGSRHYIAGALSGVMATQVVFKITNAIKNKDIKALQEDSKKKEFNLIVRAEDLISTNHYDLSLLQSYKAIELGLRQALMITDDESNQYSMAVLIQKSHTINILSKADAEKLNQIRILRNRVAHQDLEINKDTALEALSIAKRLTEILSSATRVAGYNWLNFHREVALEALKNNNDKPLTDKVITNLWDAWTNRDGAISVEISEFFSVALQNNPELILAMFSKDKKEFKSWLNQLDHQMFTNFGGQTVLELKLLKEKLILKLEDFIDEAKNKSITQMAEKLRLELVKLEIREIE